MNNSMYIELMKKILTDYHRRELPEYSPLNMNNANFKLKILNQLDRILRKKKYAVCHKIDFKHESRLEGKDWPTYADTMIGFKRLENIEYCFREIIKNNIPGDFIETGV